MKVKLLSHTPEPEKLVAAAAKLCYSNVGIETLMEALTPDKVESFLGMLGELGHQSPIEHASFTFGIEGVSRALLAQITRHRIASYSVQSQRYVDQAEFNYVLPPAIKDIPKGRELYIQSMAETGKKYEILADVLFAHHKARLMKEGVEEKEASRRAQKTAIEDARFVLPNACDTKMIATMNARSLHNFFRHRCCNRAQWEIRALADVMLQEVLEVAPILFGKAGPGCVYGACPEGRMSCGRQKEVQERYRAMHMDAHDQKMR